MEKEAAEDMAARINAVSDLSSFSAETARFLTHPLVFYPGYHLLKITDSYQNPPRKIHLIFNDSDIYVLDGSKQPLEALNEKAALSLTPETIQTYIRFYFHYVKAPEGYFYLVDTADQIPWMSEPSLKAKRAINKMLEPLEVRSLKDEKDYTAQACFFFKNALFASDIHIGLDGSVRFSKQELLVDDLPAVAHY